MKKCRFDPGQQKKFEQRLIADIKAHDTYVLNNKKQQEQSAGKRGNNLKILRR